VAHYADLRIHRLCVAQCNGSAARHPAVVCTAQTTIMKHLLAAIALGLLLSPAFAEVQVRSATLAYDTTLNVTWARDTLLFDAVAARVGGAQALKEEIYRVSPTVFELPNATWPSDGRDPITGQWYQFLNINTVGGIRTFTDFSVDSLGNTVMNWYGQNAFVNYLNATAYEGVSNWRLPGMIASGSNCLGNMVFGGFCPDSRNNNEVQSLMYSLGMDNQVVRPWTSQSSSPLYFRGLSNQREYLLRDQMRRFTLTQQDGAVFTNPPDWYLAAVTSDAPLKDPVTLQPNVLVNGIVQAKTDYAYFVMLRDGDVLAAAPPVPEPQTWALMLGGLGLVAWRAAARRRACADRMAA
jgi:hypothetical protein